MKEIDLLEEGRPIIIKYRALELRVCPIRPYKNHHSNIRIFLNHGGGLRTKTKQFPKPWFNLRVSDSDGTPTNFDERNPTACIELEPATDQKGRKIKPC